MDDEDSEDGGGFRCADCSKCLNCKTSSKVRQDACKRDTIECNKDRLCMSKIVFCNKILILLCVCYCVTLCLANNNKTMWFYATNAAKELKNEEMLIHTSKHNNVIARLDCTYNTNRLTKENDQTCACMSHFDHTKYLKHTDLCVGARVAIATVNFLPEVGLYNGRRTSIRFAGND